MRVNKYILIPFLLIFLFFTPVVFAEEDNKPEEETPTNVEQLVETEGEPVEEIVIESTSSSGYIFPYPGILPDHPLYSLKVLRDKIYDFFIKDPVKKAEFKLLMADKRMNMGLMLNEKENNSLAAKTMIDSISYYSEAIDTFISINQEEVSTNELQTKLREAGIAYESIIANYIHDVDSISAEGLTDAYQRLTTSTQKLQNK